MKNNRRYFLKSAGMAGMGMACLHILEKMYHTNARRIMNWE